MILLPIIHKANKIKFIHGRPYNPQSQGSVEAFNKYIQNALISAEDHQKDEFDLDEAVSDFCNTITKKNSTTRHTPLDIISAANNENLIQEAIENRKKSRKKSKENREIFEIDEVVRISNFLRLNSEKKYLQML